MNVTSYITKDYEKNRAFGLRQNKPNQTQCLPAISVAGQRQKMLLLTAVLSKEANNLL